MKVNHKPEFRETLKNFNFTNVASIIYCIKLKFIYLFTGVVMAHLTMFMGVWKFVLVCGIFSSTND